MEDKINPNYGLILFIVAIIGLGIISFHKYIPFGKLTDFIGVTGKHLTVSRPANTEVYSTPTPPPEVYYREVAPKGGSSKKKLSPKETQMVIAMPTPAIAPPMNAAARAQAAPEPIPPAPSSEFTFINLMKGMITIIVLIPALFMIISRKYNKETLNWCYGSVGVILGYWLKI